MRRKLADTADGREALNKRFNFCPKSNLTKPEDLKKFTGSCFRNGNKPSYNGVVI